MLWKIAYKNISSRKVVYCIIFLLLSVITITVLVLVSAAGVKLKKYAAVAKYFSQNGIMIKSEHLQSAYGDQMYLIRDEKEMMDQFPIVKEMLTVTQLWEVWITNRRMQATVWCYNKNVTELLDPAMAEGRWFDKSDYESDTLKAVAVYNEGVLSAGDVVTLKDGLGGATQEVEIIGVMENDESLFYSTTDYRDYRDCFYTYDYESEEGRMILILTDAQILGGEKDGLFGVLNFRLSPYFGFQRQMSGETVVIFRDGVTEEEIEAFEVELKQNSRITGIYPLSMLNKNSKQYIYEDLKKYMPIVSCFFIFVLIAVSSAHIVSTKKNLENYAIYYMCGLSWKQCCAISFYTSVLLASASFAFLCVLYGLLLAAGMMSVLPLDTLLLFIGIILLVDALFIAISWIMPYLITKNTSAVRVMKQG